MKIELVHADADGTRTECVDVPVGTTVADAVAASSFAGKDAAAFAVYGRRVRHGRILEEGDRVELLSELLVDPKDARRMRAMHQGFRKEATIKRGAK